MELIDVIEFLKESANELLEEKNYSLEQLEVIKDISNKIVDKAKKKFLEDCDDGK